MQAAAPRRRSLLEDVLATTDEHDLLDASAIGLQAASAEVERAASEGTSHDAVETARKMTSVWAATQAALERVAGRAVDASDAAS